MVDSRFADVTDPTPSGEVLSAAVSLYSLGDVPADTLPMLLLSVLAIPCIICSSLMIRLLIFSRESARLLAAIFPDRPRGKRFRSTGIQIVPDLWQFVHGISLSHLTLRRLHVSQLSLAVVGDCFLVISLLLGFGCFD